MLVRRVAKDSKEFYHIYEGYKINGKMFLEGKNIEDVTGKKRVYYSFHGNIYNFLMYTSINISKLIIKEKREKPITEYVHHLYHQNNMYLAM